MTKLQKFIAVALLAAIGTIVSGCSTNSPKQSSIPWSQPAGWEGQIPGMSMPTGGR